MGCRGVRPRVRYDGLSQEGNQERFAVGSRPSPSRPCCPYPDAMRRCGNQNKRRAARGEKRSRNLCVPKGRRLEDGDGKGRLPTTNHHPFFLSNNLHAKTCPRTTHREGWGDVGQLLRLDLILYMLAAAPAPAVAWRGGAQIFGAFSTVRASGQPLCCPFRASASERNSEHANRRLTPVRAIR